MRITVKRSKKGRMRTRRLKGGGTMIAPAGYSKWPDTNGCKEIRIDSIDLPVGTLIDRFGSAKGGYYAAFLQEDSTGNIIPYSYAQRSLRGLGPTAYPMNIADILKEEIITSLSVSKENKDVLTRIITDLDTLNTAGKTFIKDMRNSLYNYIYNEKNDPDNKDYSIYEVIKPLAGKYVCQAIPYFDFEGGAIQVQFDKSNDMETLIKTGYLKKLISTEIESLIGRKFPPFSSPPITTPLPLYGAPHIKAVLDFILRKPITPPIGIHRMPTVHSSAELEAYEASLRVPLP